MTSFTESYADLRLSMSTSTLLAMTIPKYDTPWSLRDAAYLRVALRLTSPGSITRAAVLGCPGISSENALSSQPLTGSRGVAAAALSATKKSYLPALIRSE